MASSQPGTRAPSHILMTQPQGAPPLTFIKCHHKSKNKKQVHRIGIPAKYYTLSWLSQRRHYPNLVIWVEVELPLSRSKLTGGTGLGLAIVKHIVARHGATLTIESEWGKGTMMQVSFPKIGAKES